MRISVMIGLSVVLLAALPAAACEDYVKASAAELTVAQAPQPAWMAAPAAIDLSAAAAKKAKMKKSKKKKEKIEYMRAAG